MRPGCALLPAFNPTGWTTPGSVSPIPLWPMPGRVSAISMPSRPRRCNPSASIRLRRATSPPIAGALHGIYGAPWSATCRRGRFRAASVLLGALERRRDCRRSASPGAFNAGIRRPGLHQARTSRRPQPRTALATEGVVGHGKSLLP